MSDLISRQAAIDAWKEDFKGFVNSLDIPRDDYKGIMEYIDEVPSVQIIHCKECLHKIKNGNHYECNYWDFEDPKDDGFCNFAERRTDEQTDRH